MKTLARDVCPHALNRDPERCYSCAREELLDALSDVAEAVLATRGSAVRTTFVTGGSPSWEPIDLSAHDFPHDIVREGNELLHAYGLTDPVTVINAVHRVAQVNTEAGHLLQHWRNRARGILDEVLRPYPLKVGRTVTATVTNDAGQQATVQRTISVTARCPVIDPKVARQCTGHLLIHRADVGLRDSDDELHGHIECSRDDSHTWQPAKGGYLRLGLLLAKPEPIEKAS